MEYTTNLHQNKTEDVFKIFNKWAATNYSSNEVIEISQKMKITELHHKYAQYETARGLYIKACIEQNIFNQYMTENNLYFDMLDVEDMW